MRSLKWLLVLPMAFWFYADYVTTPTQRLYIHHFTLRKDLVYCKGVTLAVAYHKTILILDHNQEQTFTDSWWEKGENGNTITFGIEYNW